jgi:dTDP-glucose pyrophosphorylase/predicted transcriptional regulator
MSKYRSRLQIIANILSLANERARKTQIMHRANLSYRLLCRYLREVSDAGLVSFESGNSCVLTAKGKRFLNRYEEYAKHCENLAAQLNGANGERNALERMCSIVSWADSMSSFSIGKALRLKTAFQSAPTRGVILAAGEGTRIKKVTYGAFPKELLPIGNVPTIRFPIEALKLAGVKNFLIVIAPQTKHGIIDGFQSGERLGVSISYAVQEKSEKSPAGLGPAILSSRGWVGSDEDFVVACGDSIVCDFSSSNPLDCLRSLMKIHALNEAIATVLVHPMISDPTRFGVVKFRHLRELGRVLYGEVDRLIEKPSLEMAETCRLNGHYYIVTGYYVFKPEIFSYIEKTKLGARNEVQITDAMALALENGEKVCAVVNGRNRANDLIKFEYWDVGIPEDYKEANKRLLDINLDNLIG